MLTLWKTPLQILSQDIVIICTKHEGFILSKFLFFCDFMVAEMSVFRSVLLYLLPVIRHPQEEIHVYGRK